MAEENKNVQSQDGVLMKYSMGKIILSFIYYNGLIRDTLEYVMKKPTYDVNFFKYKQTGILNEIKVNSPLKRFIDANGENGQKLLKKIEDFGDLVYGPNSTILKLADDGLRVDHAQHMAILEAVLPLHEELESIVLLHKKAALEKNELDDSINKLIDVDERFYRAVALLSLFLELRDQFGEFNKILFRPPFTQQRIEAILDSYYGSGNYALIVYPTTYTILIDPDIEDWSVYYTVLNLLRQLIPSNMVLLYGMPYTYIYLRRNHTYESMQEFTYGDLSQYVDAMNILSDVV